MRFSASRRDVFRFGLGLGTTAALGTGLIVTDIAPSALAVTKDFAGPIAVQGTSTEGLKTVLMRPTAQQIRELRSQLSPKAEDKRSVKNPSQE